jgi:hypothetical protein
MNVAGSAKRKRSIVPGTGSGWAKNLLILFIYLFIYLLTNACKQLHLTRRKKKKTEHALAVTKGSKPPPTRHSRDKINTNQ